MKKLIHTITIFLFLFFYGKTILAQCDTPTITTDWRRTGVTANTDFNWTNAGVNYPVYLQDNMSIPSFYVELPYFCSYGTCWNLNLNDEYELGNNAAAHDILPEDGWELLKYDFGTPNPSGQQTGGLKVENPYMVLYNRYTGKMKIYFCVTGIRQNANSAYIKVHFIDNSNYRRTALFANAEPISKTLKNFNNANYFQTLNNIAQQNTTTSYQWLVSEIQTMYDPCTCHAIQNLDSKMEIEVYTTDNSTITADIEGNLVQKLEDGTSGVQSESAGKSSFMKTATGAVDAATKAYKTWDGYKNQATGFLDKYNKNYQDKLMNDWWDAKLKGQPELEGLYTDADKKNMFNTFKTDDSKFSEMEGLSDLHTYNKNFQLLKGVASALPYVGTAIGVIDFLVNGGKKATPPKPSPPMTFNVALHLTGTISNDNPVSGGPIIIVPGSEPVGSPAPGLLPVYNNVLGIFNILDMPKLKYQTIVPFIKDPIVWRNGTQIPVTYQNNEKLTVNNKKLKFYELDQNVKYAVNPVAHLEVEAIDACYVLEYNASQNLYSSDFYENYANITPIPYYKKLFIQDTSLSEVIQSLKESGMELEYLSANYPNTSDPNSIIRFRTQYVPLGCLSQLNFALFGGGSMPKVYLKLLVKMKRTDAGNAEGVTQIITYDIRDALINATNENINDSAHLSFGFDYIDHIVSEELFNLNYGNLDIDSLSLNNPFYSAFNISVYSGEPLIISTGDLTIPDSSHVADGAILKATGEIKIGNGVTFGNNIQLISGKFIKIPQGEPINPSVTMSVVPVNSILFSTCTSSDVSSLKATQSEIDAICSSSTYVNNATNYTAPQVINKNKEAINYSFSVYPNPNSSGHFYSLFTLPEAENYKIILTDLTGRTVQQIVGNAEEGKNLKLSDFPSLSAGLYWVHFITDHYNSTQKIIVLK